MYYALCLVLLAVFFQSRAEAQDVVLEDQDFSSSNWTSKILPATTGGGTFTAVTESSGGNPAAYRRVIHNVQGAALQVSHLRLGDALLSYTPAQQGAIRAISYTFDVKVLQSSAGVSYQLLLHQNDATYVAFNVLKTDGLTSWTTLSSLSSLGAGEFSKIDGTGPANPDFSANGATIYFGYLTSNPVSQTCYPPYGCSPNTTPRALDTGIDNLAITISGASPTGVTCAMTPVNHFIPFHIPALHINLPDKYPNHTLKVLVTQNGAIASGVNVTLKTSQTALSLTFKGAPTLAEASAVTGDDGNAVFFHNTPASGPYTRTDFNASGSLGGHDFACKSIVVTGAGAITDAVLNFFGSPGAQQPALLGLRAALLKQRSLVSTLQQKPRYRPVIAKILGMESAHWSAREARALPELLNQLERKADAGTRKILADFDRDFRDRIANRRSASRGKSATPEAKHPVAVAANLAVRRDFARLPLGFERNRGQFQRDIQYLARGAGFNLALAGDGSVLVNASSSKRRDTTSSTVQMAFPGSRRPGRIVALDEQTGTSNYLIGKDPTKWRTGIARYGRVKYESIYPGIDLMFHGNGRQVEFDFVVAPGSHPEKIRVGFRGDVRLEREATGGLILHNSSGSLHLHPPEVYQEQNGIRTAVDGRFVTLEGNQAAFQVGPYDIGKPLVIDPVLSYSSLLGGSDYDAGAAVTLDAQGNVYMTGVTCSMDFPSLNPVQAKLAGHAGPVDSADVFVTKMDPSGTKLLYSTYIGGSGTQDAGLAIAVDQQGSAYVTGSTNSTDFPLAHPIQAIFGGGPFPSDAFVLKLDPTGSTLVYSTFLGGSGDDKARGIAVDSSGNAYVAGQTTSPDFPVKNALQAHLSGEDDAFIVKINPAGTDFVYSTFLGGSHLDIAMSVAIDVAGNAYVAGTTFSSDLPVANAFQSKYGGGCDGFVLKLSPTGAALLYSTYLGGASDEYLMGLAIDASGSAYVTGVTGSPNFPVLNALQPAFGSADGFGADAFVTKLDPSGSHLVYSTFLGGKGIDTGLAIAVGADGSAFVAGETASADFPMDHPGGGGITDGFVAKLNPGGSQLVYSTPIGGGGNDSIAGMTIDSAGNLYLAGTTTSQDFPATYGAYQTGFKGGTDVLIAKVTEGVAIPIFNTVSAASFTKGAAAPEAIMAGFGAGLATESQGASTLPLPIELAHTSVRIKDSVGSEQLAPLFYVSAQQINYLIPAGVATGLAQVTVVNGGKTVATQTLPIEAVAPGLFSANGDGHGVAAGSSIRVESGGKQETQSLFECGSAAGSCKVVPVDLADGSEKVYLVLFGTGIRGRSALSGVTAFLGGVEAPVVFAGSQGPSAGLDQVNIGPLPIGLKGKGEVEVVVAADGKRANAVTVSFR